MSFTFDNLKGNIRKKHEVSRICVILFSENLSTVFTNKIHAMLI